MYRFFPTEEEIITGKKGKYCRYIFDAGTVFNEYENQMLQELEAYIIKENIPIPNTFVRLDRLKFLQANKYKTKKTCETIIEHLKWREANLPIKITPGGLELINHGFMYVHGRDKRFRPCLVLNAIRIEQMKKAQAGAYDMDSVVNVVLFQQEYVMKYMFLPGQVENWVVIIDISKLPVEKFPKPEIKRIMGILQNNYRCRLGRMWMLNATKAQMFLWKIVSVFIEKETIQKISFTSDPTHKDLKANFLPINLETKYGGMATEPTNYWPPAMPGDRFIEDPTRLLNDEQYKAMLASRPGLKQQP